MARRNTAIYIDQNNNNVFAQFVFTRSSATLCGTCWIRISKPTCLGYVASSRKVRFFSCAATWTESMEVPMLASRS